MIIQDERFIIKVAKKRSLAGVLANSGYAKVNYVVKEWVTKERFACTDVLPQEVVIRLLSFDKPVTLDELLEASIQRKLMRPLDYDALLFGEQFPDQQVERPIMFPSYPGLLYGGLFFFLTLDTNRVGGREINPRFRPGEWDETFRFAFRERA